MIYAGLKSKKRKIGISLEGIGGNRRPIGYMELNGSVSFLADFCIGEYD